MSQKPGPKPLRIMGKALWEWSKELSRSETSIRHCLARYPVKVALVPKKPKKVEVPRLPHGRPRGSTKDDAFVSRVL